MHRFISDCMDILEEWVRNENFSQVMTLVGRLSNKQ